MGTTNSVIPWEGWIIDRYIGKSENSAFYQVHQEETNESASIEQLDLYLPDEFEMQLMRKGASVKNYSDFYLAEAIKRIEIAKNLDEIPGIVGIKEYTYTPNVRAGYTIFLRRSFAYSLTDYLEENALTLKEYVQMAVELCEALEACHERSIVYNALRMDSVYVNEDKHFCLGTDHFLSLRSFEEKIDRFYMEGLTDSGAPETLNKGECSPVSDVYTLGLLLYCIFNEGKIPFLPSKQKKRSDLIYQGAIERRLRGEKVADPANGTPEMIEVIKKACEFEPENRYQSIAELKSELIRLLENDLVVPPSDDEDDDVDDEFATSDYKAEMEAREKLEKLNQQRFAAFNEVSDTPEEKVNPDNIYRRKKYNKPKIVRIIAFILFLMFIVVQILNSGLWRRSAAVPQEQTETQQTETETQQAETE